ncbi:MAG: formate dehydrogenase accessory sulfurtransferase FdhD, partial [Firmicutes bacterium]|nr:formate dehydrogenase accessory sulfurtransferase FdhD [Bacillota bacterium]
MSEVKRQLLSEHKTNIFIGSRLAMSVVGTADLLPELAVGRLISERVINNISDIEYIYVCESGEKIKLIINKNTTVSLAVPETLSCCSDNKTYLYGSAEFQPMEKANIDESEIFKIISAAAEDT